MTRSNLFLLSFVLASIIDYLIKNDYLGNKIKYFYFKLINKSHFTFCFILFSIIFICLTLLGYFDVTLISLIEDSSFSYDFNSHLSDKTIETDNSSTTSTSSAISTSSTTSNNTVEASKDGANTRLNDSNQNMSIQATGNINDGTVNVNSPYFNLSVDKNSFNNLAAAASVTGGASLALKAMQQMPGSPATKAIAGAGTMLAVQAGTAIMSKILNNENVDKTNTKSLIGNILNNTDGQSLNNVFSEFPFNLLPEVSKLVDVELLFLLVIFNVYIGTSLANIDFSIYIPNNKLGKILTIIINRYIKIWTNSARFLMIFSWFMLFVCVLLLKVCMFYIFNTN
jgi:hypothetical protein